MSSINFQSTTRYELAWSEPWNGQVADLTNDATEEGTAYAQTLTLIDHEQDDDEVDGLILMVRDDDPDQENKINGGRVHREFEDLMLARNHLSRSQVEITSAI